MSWPMVALGEVFDPIRNGKSIANQKSGSGAPITRIETISGGFVDPERVGYADLGIQENKKWLLQKGDILFSHINSVEHIGKTALYTGIPPELVHGMNLLMLRPKSGKIDPSFAKRALSTARFKSSIEKFVNRAVNQASISITNLKQVEIPLPPLDEQKRIAEILDQADALRRKRRDALALLDTLTQSIFVEMFGDLSDAPRFALKDLGNVITGSTPPTSDPTNFDGDIPFLTPGDLESREPPSRFVSEKGVSKSRTAVAGSTLVCCIGATIGKIDTAVKESAFNQQINAIEWGEKIAPKFGRAAVESIRATIIHQGKGAATTLPILKKSSFAKLEIPVPSIGQQQEFAKNSHRIAEERERQERSVLHLDSLFASLQSRAFSGDL